jgi:UDP-glucose 4-epimerase
MPRAIVTGGAGFIGSHLVDALVRRGDPVLIVDNLITGKRENVNPDADFEETDIRTPAAAELVRRFQPEIIFHHAAQMDVRKSVADPLYDADVNIRGLINLLEAATEVGTRQVVFASSGGTVYGEADEVPTTESAPLRPESPYGVSKLSSEYYLGYYGRGKGLSCVSLRYGNVYGPRQDPHGEAGVVAIFTGLLLEGRRCKIFGDGEQTRDYVHVQDVVSANLAAMERGPEGAISLNVGTAMPTSVNTLQAMLADFAGGDPDVERAPAREGELQRSALDFSKAREVLGWRPEVQLCDGLRSYVEHMRAQRVPG